MWLHEVQLNYVFRRQPSLFQRLIEKLSVLATIAIDKSIVLLHIFAEIPGQIHQSFPSFDFHGLVGQHERQRNDTSNE